MSTIHECEPDLKKLEEIRKELLRDTSVTMTVEQGQRIKALDSQIARHRREADAQAVA